MAGRSSSSNRASSSQSGFKRFVLKTIHYGFVSGLWACIILSALIVWYAAELPSLIQKPGVERRPAITVKDMDGNAVAHYGEFKGETIDVSDMPPNLPNAVLAIEDRRFYQHMGIDPIGIGRAIVNDVRGHGGMQGGSTITQQLAKNLFLSRERTLKRKIQEAMLAIWLEHKYTKNQILTAYLNQVYLGAGTFGVEAAAQTYFGKSARDLDLRECAIIAGLLKAPSRYSPLSNPRLANQRADTVIAAMGEAGYLTKRQAAQNKQSKKGAAPAKQAPEKVAASDGVRYYTDWVVSDLDKLTGTPNEDITIETTLVPEIQRAAEAAVAKALTDAKDKNVSQAAVMVMARDGAILAMVGGRDYGQSQFNRAVQGYRQPGSSFKPVVYLTALEHGYTPDTMVTDAPISEGKYRPTNFKAEYMGEVPLKVALAYSLNTVSYRIAKDVGIGYVIGTARRLGIEADLQRDLSLALGSSGVPMIQMITAYGAIANNGHTVTPYAIRRITDKSGTLIYERDPNADPGRDAFDPGVVQELKGMMEGVTEFGTGTAARFGPTIAGKTGTSQDFRDAWFDGFSNDYIATVWVGNDDNSSMKRVTGGSIPAHIWRDVMIAATNSGKGKSGYAPPLASANSSQTAPEPVSAGAPLGGPSQDEFGDLLHRLLKAPSTPIQADTGADEATAPQTDNAAPQPDLPPQPEQPQPQPQGIAVTVPAQPEPSPQDGPSNWRLND